LGAGSPDGGTLKHGRRRGLARSAGGAGRTVLSPGIGHRLLSAAVHSPGRLGRGVITQARGYAQDHPTRQLSTTGFVETACGRKTNILVAELCGQMVVDQPAPDGVDAKRITDIGGAR
jgi:hypothetical protein